MKLPLTREHIVTEARRWIGTPYQHQASLIGIGADCLGLVRGVWRTCIGPEPEATGPYSADWAEATGQERLFAAGEKYFSRIEPASAEPGDVLLFRWRDHVPAKHLAIVSTPGMMIHAHDGANVAEVALAPWWQRRLAFAFTFPGITG